MGKSNSRKSKSPIPGQGYLGSERPSSVSSVHSEGDYHRQTPVWAWEDRPSSTGESWVSCTPGQPGDTFRRVTRRHAVTLGHWSACEDFLKQIFCCLSGTDLSEQLMFLTWGTLSDSGSTQFPYNPLTMRMLSSTPPTSITCAPPSMSQATTHQQNRIWEREPAPLLSAQYETLSDSDD